MRLRRRYVLAAALLGVMAATLSVASGSEITPTVEAVSAGVGYAWSPTSVSVATGGSVDVSNSSAIPHGVKWISGPNTPTCDSGVPVGTTASSSGGNWSGSCKFTQAGTYVFYCTVHGPEMTETVTVATPGAPVTSTGASSGVSRTGATVEGSVNPEKKATTYHFDYGTSTSYGQQSTTSSAGEGETSQDVSATLSGLAPGTTYHYRLSATNEAGTTVGVDRTFTTESAPGAPVTTTGAAGSTSETASTLSGTVNPDGQKTEYEFEWGLTSSYGNATSTQPLAGEDHAAHAVSANLSGLLPGTTYHYRLVAQNATGSSPGVDRQFTTLSPPEPTPEPKPEPTPPSPPATSTPTPAPVVTSPPAPSGPSAPAPSPTGTGPLLSALKLTVPHHGSTVSGSLQAGASGRVEIELLAKASAVGGKGSKGVLVGHLQRTTTGGKVSFSLALDSRGKQALKRHHSLAVSLKVTFVPKHGAKLSTVKSVTLRS